MIVQDILREWGFSGLRLLAGFNARHKAAEWLGVSESTLKRREAAECLATARLLAIKAGWIGLIDDAWDEWILRGGALCHARREWRPGDLMAQMYERALIAELQKQLREYQAEKTAASADGRTLAPVIRLEDYR